jgi:aspartate oxidase
MRSKSSGIPRRTRQKLYSIFSKSGVAFDRHNSELALTLEAAHSRHRVLPRCRHYR